MKKLIIAVAALMVSVGAYGQGQFFFSNRDTANGVNARFVLPTDAAGTSSVGAGYTVTLTGGAAGAPVGSLVALSPGTTDFRTSSAAAIGYVNPITVTVPGVAAGAGAEVMVNVKGPGGVFSQLFNVTALGGGTATPPTLPMGTASLTLTPVPEPATLALGALGLGALLAIRRRK